MSIETRDNSFIRSISLIFILALLLLSSSNSSTDAKMLNVEDSFERTLLYDTQARPDDQFIATPFLFSPDHSKLIAVIGRGNSRKLTYEFNLIMFETSEIMNFLDSNNSKDPPKPVILATIYHDQNSIPFAPPWEQAGIKHLRFSSNGNILFFLGADENGYYQINKVDLTTRQVKKLTNMTSYIYEYIMPENSEYILFTISSRKKRYSHCEAPSYSVNNMFLGAATCYGEMALADYFNVSKNPLRPINRPAELYRLSSDGESAPELIADQIVLNDSLEKMIVSPDGQYAAVVTKTEQLPKNYKENLGHREGANGVMKNDIEDQHNMYTSDRESYSILTVVDIKNKIVDNYRGAIFANGEHKSIYWVGPNSLYLKNILLLPDESDNSEIRTTSAVMKLVDGRIHYNKISENNIGPVGKLGLSNDIKFEASEDKTSIVNHCNERPVGIGSKRTLESETSCYIDNNIIALRVTTGEKFDSLANIIVQNLKSKVSKKLYELNPQLKEISLGKVEIIEWNDENGLRWYGGLVLPPQYRPGRRYPVVIQTHGFNKNRFLMDGPIHMTMPDAAQALANRNIIVVQVPDVSSNVLGQEDAHLARGINAVIKLLESRGQIDIKKIGITGFSARGSFAFKMAIFPKYRPRAIVISDAYGESPLSYAYNFGYGFPGMTWLEKAFCGSMPWGPSQSEWIRRNPYYHLDNLDSAVLISTNTGEPSDWWDIYAGLRRLNKAAEYQIFRSLQHPPKDAKNALLGQRLVVDWYDFWLNDKEDTNPAKSAQYESWRQLREASRLGSKSHSATDPLSSMDCGSEASFQ